MASGYGSGREPNRDRDRDRIHSRNRTPGRDSKTQKSETRARAEREPENKVLDSVLGALFFVVIGVSNFFKKIAKSKNKNYFTYAYIAAGIIIIAFAGYLLYWSATNINAQTVYLDDVKIGTFKIPKDGAIEASYIEELAIGKIKTEAGAEVLVTEKVTVKSVHAKEKLVQLDSIVSEIANKYTYKLAAVRITVDGEEMAIVGSEQIANEILNGIKDGYKQSTLNITSATFVEDVKSTVVYVDKSDIISKDAANAILTSTSKAEQTYEIKSGDTLGKIASNAGMTLDELLEINPDYTINTKLKIGNKLKLAVSRPLLSVKTLEPFTYPEVIPKTIVTQYTDSLKKGDKSIVQQGKDGRKEITANIIRINGYEQKERDIIDEKIIEAAIDEIVNVGTK